MRSRKTAINFFCSNIKNSIFVCMCYIVEMELRIEVSIFHYPPLISTKARCFLPCGQNEVVMYLFIFVFERLVCFFKGLFFPPWKCSRIFVSMIYASIYILSATNITENVTFSHVLFLGLNVQICMGFKFLSYLCNLYFYWRKTFKLFFIF